MKIEIKIIRKCSDQNATKEIPSEDAKKKRDYWLNEYWPDLQKASFDSESKLEKYLFTVSSGAFGLLLGTMGFIKKPDYISLLFCCFGAFACSLLLCIIYHVIAKRGHKKQFEMIEKFVKNPNMDDTGISKRIKRRNSFLDCLHVFSLIFIIAGMILFVLYLSNNIQQ